MKRILILLLFGVLLSGPALAGTEILLDQGDGTHEKLGGDGHSLYAIINELRQLLAGEDTTNQVIRVENQWEYEDIAASQTDQVLGGAGAAGDLLAGLFCTFSLDPSTAVTVKDGSGSSFTVIPDSGAAGFYNSGALNWVSTSGAWSITTGTNTTCRASGRFS